MKKSKVAVLMSTYNGERYLKEQLDSIFAQEDVEVSVLVRDDGSTDATMSILSKYESSHQLKKYTGENLGPARSFMQLLADAPSADYYAFSDQDDYWTADKLSTATSMLEKSGDAPALYFCQTQLADACLNPLPPVTIHPQLTFAESMIYQFVGGCTMVMNGSLRDMVLRYKPGTLFMHDVWIYCIALAVGANVYFDPVPHMLYRQHSANVVGQGFSRYTALKRRWNRVFGGSHIRHAIARELMQGYADCVTPENLSLLKEIVNYRNNLPNRLRLLFDPRFDCSKKQTYVLFKLAVLLGTY